MSHRYDGLHRLTSADYETADGSESFHYDLLGNRTGDGAGSNGFGYSDTRAGGAGVAYGANNEANEYSTIGGENVLHDAAGNLIRDEDGLGYGYDAENRLTQVFEDADSNGAYNQGVDTLLVEYNYDALGRRIEKIDHAGAEPVTTGYVYDGQNVLAEFNTNGTLQRYFVNGPTYIDERVLMHDATTGDEYYYLLKELYSVAGLANTNGELVEAYAYDAYGKVHVFASGAVCFDSDDDGDTDLADFADFQACFSGDGTPSTCAAALVNAFDSDGDADIDLTDLAAMVNCMDGPWSSLSANGDFNSNGVVDNADADAFDDCIENHSTNGVCLAAFDFDGSGEVDIYDAGVMAGLLGTFVGQPVHACLSQTTTSTVGNPYFFTGRRLDTLVHTNGVKQLQYNRKRYFNFDRWLQRDPLGTTPLIETRALGRSSPRINLSGRTGRQYFDGMNLYEYVQSNPVVATDPFGLRSGSSYGPWIADGSVNWTRAGSPFFFYGTSVSLPTSGWLGVVLETLTACYPATATGEIDNFVLVSKWRPGELFGVTCYCPWKRQQPCKRCVTTTTQRGWGPWGGDNPTTVKQNWQRRLMTGGYAVTQGLIGGSFGSYSYRCTCNKPTIKTPICPKRPKAKCGC